MTTTENPRTAPIVVAITGASGAAYGVRLLEVLLAGGYRVHLTISPSGVLVLKQELALQVDLHNFTAASLLGDAVPAANLRYHRYDDLMAPIASGSFLTQGMVICPCSGGTLSGVVHGTSDNLIERAADVQLKEGRKLILTPRETPLSIIQIDNMRRACEAGAIVLPASPGWYHGVQSVQDLIDFIVARILDQLGVEHALMKRWGGDQNDVSV
ncbi:UbiX family flavin prenyltransferase [Lignipirellula cremea]|uniref:Flavin prenyltransferase UbiX n=1 Tax=Lignipirellula cremea TaxID=2528010 RepID=A0A518DRG2_9BACT|nr:flavin prenyltransferase UbiX [Lignipirellula cremea]QDU94421.1 putative aromatic acid decarboxylase [Lignipirellula cremea]